MSKKIRKPARVRACKGEKRTDQQARSLPSEGFAREPMVRAVVPFSRATLWLKVRQGQFPKPVKLSERVTAWRVCDVRAWIARHGAGVVA